MSTLAALIAAGALAPGEGVLRVKFKVRAIVLLCRIVRFRQNILHVFCHN